MNEPASEKNEKSEQNHVGRELQTKTMGYLVTAFGLVAGLAWNDAVRGLIEAVFPIEKNSVLAKFIYAIIITVLVVIVTTYVFKSSDGKKS